jgi:hypothetical protein
MAAAHGVVYVPVVNLPSTYATPTARLGRTNFLQAGGEMDALSLATGKQLWDTTLPGMPLGGATIANDLVFTTTFTGEVVALSRKDGSIVWTAHLPAGSNATLAIAGNTLLAGAGVPLATTQHPAVVAYRLEAKGIVAPMATRPGPVMRHVDYHGAGRSNHVRRDPLHPQAPWECRQLMPQPGSRPTSIPIRC